MTTNEKFKQMIRDYIIENKKPPSSLTVSIEFFADMYINDLLRPLGGGLWHCDYICVDISD